MEEMFGQKLVSGETVVDTASQFGDGIELIGIYFSAHWCPPCRGFTPKLVDFYDEMNANGKKLEIVFVTRDRDEQSFLNYFKDMPWLALPFDQQEAKNADLCKTHNVSGIPSLVFITKDGNVKHKDGRGCVMKHLDGGEKFAW